MDLISADQVKQIRDAFRDLSDTFQFPITIKKTQYADNAPFLTPPVVVDYPCHAIREFAAGSSEAYRNNVSTAAVTEMNLYVGWHEVEALGLNDPLTHRILLDHNDVVEMEGEIYEILSFAGVADMTKKPVFLELVVRRRFQSPSGAGGV